LGQHREQSETKEFAAAPSLNVLRGTQRRKDKGSKNPRLLLALDWGLANFAIKQTLSISHLYSISQASLLKQTRLLLWLRRLRSQLQQSFGSGTHGREDKCFLAQTNRKL